MIYLNKSDFKNNKMLIKQLMNKIEVIEIFIDIQNSLNISNNKINDIQDQMYSNKSLF